MEKENQSPLRNKVAVVTLPALSRVALCGGTHGNELSGIYLVQEKLKNKRKSDAMEAVTVVTVISNPRAVQQCSRYTETDLNRCFTHASLSAPVSERTPYEIVRSQELNSLLGPKGSDQAVDLICDLHNTTANMGLCLITYADNDWICLHICKHLQRELVTIPVRYIHYDVPLTEAFSLESVGKHGFGFSPPGLMKVSEDLCTVRTFVFVQTVLLESLSRATVGLRPSRTELELPQTLTPQIYHIRGFTDIYHFAMEIGPQPHGVIRSNIFTAMQEAVHLVLEWVRLFNSGTQFEEGSVDVYTMVKNIDYPRDPLTHTITAAVHPELQDRDFCLLHPGDPMFLSFSGDTLRYRGKESLYPFFINECAYYEKGVALCLARRRKVKIPAIQCSRV